MTTTTGRAPVDPPEDAHLARQIVDGLSEGFLSLDPEWRLTDCNRAAERLLGRPRQDLLGRTIGEILGATMDSPLGVLGRRVAATQTAESAEVAYPKTGEGRLLSVQVFPLGAGIGVVWRDITEIRAAEQRLAESQALYSEIADGTPAASWLSRADGTLEFINQAMADALGQSRAALLGKGWMDFIDPEDGPAMLKARMQAWSIHRQFHYEGRFRRADGALRIFELWARPRFDRSGAFRGYVGVATDVTDARAAERRQKLLMDELNHRVKNMLATVQSIVRHTLREGRGAKEAESLVTERLMALSAAHDVLTKERWEGAELADIAQAAVKPYADSRQITLSGPPARIAPNVAVALSMALNELAVNAIRHGALSAPAGQVRLSWTRTDKTITLEWRESDGPAVTAPERAGFGSRLLGRGLTGELGQPAELIYAPEGVICRMRAPAESNCTPPLRGGERPARSR